MFGYKCQACGINNFCCATWYAAVAATIEAVYNNFISIFNRKL